jgi:hypothetical protein
MKNLKFFLCSLLFLSFCFSSFALTDAKKISKTEVFQKQFYKDQTTIANTINIPEEVGWQNEKNSFIFNTKKFNPDFAYLFKNYELDIFKIKNQNLYFEKLNREFILDFRFLLNKKGILQSRKTK